MTDHLKADLIRWLRADVSRATGRRYDVKLEALDVESLRALQRLLRDLDADKRQAVSRARVEPWRH